MSRSQGSISSPAMVATSSGWPGGPLVLVTATYTSGALDQLDAVLIRVADEAEPAAARADGVGRPLGLDALLGELGERLVEVADGHRDVPVAGADLVRADAEVVGQLETVVVARQAH